MIILCFSVYPPLTSRTYLEVVPGSNVGHVGVLQGFASFWMWMILLFVSIQMMSRGISVFFIQNRCIPSFLNIKSMPQDSQSSVRCISPLVISSGVVASSVSMQMLSKHTVSWFCLCAAVRKSAVNPMIISA